MNSKTIHRGTAVSTPDGPGVITGKDRRKNTNGGPGTWQYVVELADKRVRRYTGSEVTT